MHILYVLHKALSICNIYYNLNSFFFTVVFMSCTSNFVSPPTEICWIQFPRNTDTHTNTHSPLVPYLDFLSPHVQQSLSEVHADGRVGFLGEVPGAVEVSEARLSYTGVSEHDYFTGATHNGNPKLTRVHLRRFVSLHWGQAFQTPINKTSVKTSSAKPLPVFPPQRVLLVSFLALLVWIWPEVEREAELSRELLHFKTR